MDMPKLESGNLFDEDTPIRAIFGFGRELTETQAAEVIRRVEAHDGLVKALREIKEHEEYLGIPSVYYDTLVFTIAQKALKDEPK